MSDYSAISQYGKIYIQIQLYRTGRGLSAELMKSFFFLHFPTNLEICEFKHWSWLTSLADFARGIKTDSWYFRQMYLNALQALLKCKLLHVKFEALLGKYQACKYNLSLHCSYIKTIWMPSHVAGSRNKRGHLKRTTWPAFPPLPFLEKVSFGDQEVNQGEIPWTHWYCNKRNETG